MAEMHCTYHIGSLGAQSLRVLVKAEWLGIDGKPAHRQSKHYLGKKNQERKKKDSNNNSNVNSNHEKCNSGFLTVCFVLRTVSSTANYMPIAAPPIPSSKKKNFVRGRNSEQLSHIALVSQSIVCVFKRAKKSNSSQQIPITEAAATTASINIHDLYTHLTWDARHGPVRWRPTGSFGNRLRHCGRLRTSPYSPHWKSSMAGNAEEVYPFFLTFLQLLWLGYPTISLFHTNTNIPFS